MENWIDTIRQDLAEIGLSSEEAKERYIDEEDWRQCVAQCVFDTAEPRMKDPNFRVRRKCPCCPITARVSNDVHVLTKSGQFGVTKSTSRAWR